MNRTITLSTCTFGPLPENSDVICRHFDMAMEAGFDGFELCMIPEHVIPYVLKAIRQTEAKIVAVHGVPRGDWLAADPAVQKTSAQASARYLAFFEEFAPCPVIQHYIDRYNDPEPGKNFRAIMEILLEETEKLNFLFCMENAPYKPEVDERFPTVAEVARFARSFGENRMFMTFDLNHANLHEDPAAVCADCAGLVKHIHISDNHGIREEHLVPGTGTMDLAEIMAALAKHGYTGPWNLEFSFPQAEVPTVEKYRQVYQYMQTLLDKPGFADIL